GRNIFLLGTRRPRSPVRVRPEGITGPRRLIDSLFGRNPTCLYPIHIDRGQSSFSLQQTHLKWTFFLTTCRDGQLVPCISGGTYLHRSDNSSSLMRPERLT